MKNPRLIFLTNLKSLRATGIVYLSSVHDWRLLFRSRGLADSFGRVEQCVVPHAARCSDVVHQGRAA
jgi:hypothetical protein